jgi:hypothetical protein
MAPSCLRPPEAALLLDDEQEILRSPTCPICLARASLPQNTIEAGGGWRCVRCGQHWDSARLAAAPYAEWASDHDRVSMRGAESSYEAVHGDGAAQQLGGRP